MLEVFLKYFRQGNSLLELNCGTGSDAISLARCGMKILATDLSPAMIDVVRNKVNAAQLGGRVTTAVIGFNDLQQLRGKAFDGAYSDMGGLNCTDNLVAIAHNLHLIVKPGGYFIASVMTDFSLWETVAHILRGKWVQAFRRSKRNGATAKVHGMQVRVHYYSPREITRAFEPDFVPVEITGLNIFTPPPTSHNAYRRLGKLNNLLERLDNSIARAPFFKGIGDHSVVVFRHAKGDPS